MDWIKVKAKHVDYDFRNQPDNVFRAWIESMIYCAAIERIPTEKELEKRIGKDNLRLLEVALKESKTSLSCVLKKVYEDIEYCIHHRKTSRDYWRRSRNLPSTCRKGDVNLTTRGEERRVEESREDNTHTMSELFTSWNAFTSKQPSLSPISKLTPARKAKLLTRIRGGRFLENWGKVLEIIPKCPFLLGKGSSKWKVTFDWLIHNEENFTKVLEGNYIDKEYEKELRRSENDWIIKPGGENKAHS